jgi:hypothetical protein
VTAVVELGSFGTGTITRSRADVDIILISPGEFTKLPYLLSVVHCNKLDKNGILLKFAFSAVVSPFEPLHNCPDKGV